MKVYIHTFNNFWGIYKFGDKASGKSNKSGKLNKKWEIKTKWEI